MMLLPLSEVHYNLNLNISLQYLVLDLHTGLFLCIMNLSAVVDLLGVAMWVPFVSVGCMLTVIGATQNKKGFIIAGILCNLAGVVNAALSVMAFSQ
jgi:hypothetical protein